MHWWDLPEPSSGWTFPALRRDAQSRHHHGRPLMDSLQYVHVPLLLGSPALDRVLQVWPHQCRVEGKDHLPWPAGNTLANAAEYTIIFLCWLMFSLVFPRTSKALLAKLLSIRAWWLPACTVDWSCSFPGAWLRTSFSLLSFMRLLSAHFSSLLRPLWMAAWPLVYHSLLLWCPQRSMLRLKRLCNSTSSCQTLFVWSAALTKAS